MTSRYNLITYSLIFGSIFSWSIAMIRSNPNMGDFGLVNSLSIFYFIALIMLLGSFLLTLTQQNQDKRIYSVLILLLVMYLFLTPTIIEDTARFRYSYKVHGYIDYINRNGHINPYVIWYHNWPGTFLSTSMLSAIINPNNDYLFMKYFPFIIQIIYFFPMYIFLKSLVQDEKNEKLIWIAIWIFYILNFINQDYISPQAHAYLYFLIFLSIIVKIGDAGKNSDIYKNISYKFICIILFSGLVITHMMTSMLILSILILSALFLSSNRKYLHKLILLCIIILAAWTIYGASNYFNSYLLDFVDKSYKMDLILDQNLKNRVIGSPAHVILAKLMIFTTLISIGFAAIGIILSYYRKDKLYFINMRLLTIVGAIFVTAPSSSYGGELIMRIFLFMIPFLSFFISQLLINLNTKIILIFFLVIMTPLNIITHYGNEKYDFVSKAELVSYDFLYDKIDNGNITGGFPSYAYRFPERYNSLDFKDMRWDGKEYTVETGKHYNIAISRGDKDEFEIFYNNKSFIEDIENNIMGSNNYIHIYSNMDMNIYEIVKK